MAEMRTGQKFLLIAVFLITGSINTMTKKWQFQTCGPSYSFSSQEVANNQDCYPSDGGTTTPLPAGSAVLWKHFHKPWTQNIQMFIGEALVIILFFARKPARARELQELGNARGAGEEPKTAPFYIFLLPACCDILGTGVGGVGMLFISASVWQMMRGSLMIFAALWSVIFLKKKLPCYNWVAVLVSACGLLLIGISAILDEGSDKGSSNVPLGILLTVVSQAFAAAQMVVEEIYVKGQNAPPEQVVGSEGVWGIIMMILILFVMYWIPGNDGGSYENAVDSVHMLFNSQDLLIFVAFYLVSIAFFNFCGVTIAGKLSTVTRTINDALRTIIIWSIEIIVYYFISKDYGSPWATHSYLQLLGFVLLIVATLIKNAIIKVPGLRYDEDEVGPKPLTTSTAGVSLMEGGQHPENPNQPRSGNA